MSDVKRPCVKCGQKSIKKAYCVVCSSCAEKDGICAKCLQREDSIERVGLSEQEQAAHESQLQQELKLLPERKRRTFMRLQESGKFQELEEDEAAEGKSWQGEHSDQCSGDMEDDSDENDEGLQEISSFQNPDTGESSDTLKAPETDSEDDKTVEKQAGDGLGALTLDSTVAANLKGAADRTDTKS